jgi:hypothetical protein
VIIAPCAQSKIGISHVSGLVAGDCMCIAVRKRPQVSIFTSGRDQLTICSVASERLLSLIAFRTACLFCFGAVVATEYGRLRSSIQFAPELLRARLRWGAARRARDAISLRSAACRRSSTPPHKNIPLYRNSEMPYVSLIPAHLEGRSCVVRFRRAGLAVDAAASGAKGQGQGGLLSVSPRLRAG